MRKSHINLLIRKRSDFIRLACSLGVSPEDAEDLTNDCFEKIWNSPLALELQSEEEFMLFAQRILHNLTMDYYKKRRKEVLTDFGQESVENTLHIPNAPGPEEELLKKEQNEELRAAFQRLSEEERNLLLEHYYLDQKYPKIAERTGENENTLRKKASRAITKLREMLCGGG